MPVRPSWATFAPVGRSSSAAASATGRATDRLAYERPAIREIPRSEWSAEILAFVGRVERAQAASKARGLDPTLAANLDLGDEAAGRGRDDTPQRIAEGRQRGSSSTGPSVDSTPPPPHGGGPVGTDSSVGSFESVPADWEPIEVTEPPGDEWVDVEFDSFGSHSPGTERPKESVPALQEPIRVAPAPPLDVASVSVLQPVERRRCVFPGCGEPLPVGFDVCVSHRTHERRLKEARDHFVTADRLIDQPIPATEWVLGGVGPENRGAVQSGDTVALGAFSGRGKTVLVMNVAIASAASRTFAGVPVWPGLRTIVFTESSRRQIMKVIHRAGLTSAEAARIAIVFSTLVTAPVVEFLIREHRADIAIFDTATSIFPNLGLLQGRHGFDWNNPDVVTEVASWLRRVVVAHRLKALFYLCHTSKASNDTGLKAFRGTGALVEQADVAFILTPSDGEKAGFLTCVKSRASDETLEHIPFYYDHATGAITGLDAHKSEEAILGVLSEHPEGLSGQAIRDKVTGKAEVINAALKALESGQRILSNKLKGRAHLYLPAVPPAGAGEGSR
jgi:hypothetical protein